MKILFIIGNGFDINLGLKTRYADFLEYYKSISTESVIIKKLKDTISEKLKDWSDLELALGDYTQHLSSVNEVDEVFNDITDKLSEYLIEEEKKINPAMADKERLFECLSFPERSLLQADLEKLSTYRTPWARLDWNVDVITLNYTRVLESIIGDRISNLTMLIREGGARIKLRSIEHLHGYVDDHMILGVNDKTQIKNLDFHNELDILETLVKSDCNRALKHNVDNKSINLIKEANLICVFGSSIGETDSVWWELLAERLKAQSQLIIFTRTTETNRLRSHLNARSERALKRLFLMRAKLSDEDKKIIEDNIYIGVNTGMFSNILNSLQNG